MVDVTIISDTHMRHRDLDIGSGDLLIHCGDMFNLFGDGHDDPIDGLDTWFGSLDFAQIICIGGNHDRALQERLGTTTQPFRHALLLHDRLFEYAGLCIYGSPWVPQLHGHAFFADDQKLASAWEAVPVDLDILVTHTPPLGVLDQSSRGHALGCAHLARQIGRIAPRLHCFGHVHASAGEKRIGDTHFINASSVVSRSNAVRAPFCVQL